MVLPSEFEIRKSTKTVSGISSLGGDIDLTAGGLIDLAGEDNLFDTVSRSELVAGDTEYRIFYIRYTGAEVAKNIKLGLIAHAPNSLISWAFDPLAKRYLYAPSYLATGSSYIEIADSASLDLNNFTICVRFKTSATYSTEGAIVNKGGFGSDASGENMNYGIFIDSDNKIKGEFETSAGTNYRAISTGSSYNDNNWHFACVTHDGTNVKLYLDGNLTADDTVATSGAVPETNAKPLRIGANSRANDKYFTGEIDEIYVWNLALTAAEQKALADNNVVPQIDNIVYSELNGQPYQTYYYNAQELTNESTAPSGSPVWQNAIIVTPDDCLPLPDMRTGDKIPIIVKWQVLAAGSVTDYENAKMTLRLFMEVTSGQTGGEDSGGDAPDSNTNIKIAVAGDWGCEPETKDVVNFIASKNYDLVISTGDNSYSSSESCFFDTIKSIDNTVTDPLKFITTLGNHDDEKSSKRNDTLNHFKMPAQYTSYTFGNVFVLIMSTEISFGVSSAQYDFVASELENARKNPNIDWIIVAYHRATVGAVSKHAYNEGNFMQTYWNLFYQYEVDIVVTGHNHNFQRTFQIRQDPDSAGSVKNVDKSTTYTGGKGLVHIVSGTGGHDSGSSLYSLGSQPSYQAFQDNDNNGIYSLELSNNGKTLTGKCITIDNTTLDTFVINR